MCDDRRSHVLPIPGFTDSSARCGFIAQSALELSDGSQVRIDKIYQLIGECRFGVHDLSMTSLDPVTQLPRFNMPLELGIFLGTKRFGSASYRQKRCLVLVEQQYAHQKYCSDIAGQELWSHGQLRPSTQQRAPDPYHHQ